MQYPESWSKDAVCTCADIDRSLRIGARMVSSCPLLFHIKIPMRNQAMWETVYAMFQKTLDSKEKAFWSKHFGELPCFIFLELKNLGSCLQLLFSETNIGIRLARWLIGNEEKDAVIDEFVHCLQTSVTYGLSLDAIGETYLRIPSQLKISGKFLKFFY